MTSADRDALHARNRAEVALATAADIAARWDTMIADNRYLESQCDSLNSDVRDLRQRVRDLEALIVQLIP